jgi:hypothetical protein
MLDFNRKISPELIFEFVKPYLFLADKGITIEEKNFHLSYSGLRDNNLNFTYDDGHNKIKMNCMPYIASVAVSYFSNGTFTENSYTLRSHPKLREVSILEKGDISCLVLDKNIDDLRNVKCSEEEANWWNVTNTVIKTTTVVLTAIMTTALMMAIRKASKHNHKQLAESVTANCDLPATIVEAQGSASAYRQTSTWQADGENSFPTHSGQLAASATVRATTSASTSSSLSNDRSTAI